MHIVQWWWNTYKPIIWTCAATPEEIITAERRMRGVSNVRNLKLWSLAASPEQHILCANVTPFQQTEPLDSSLPTALWTLSTEDVTAFPRAWGDGQIRSEYENLLNSLHSSFWVAHPNDVGRDPSNSVPVVISYKRPVPFPTVSKDQFSRDAEEGIAPLLCLCCWHKMS